MSAAGSSKTARSEGEAALEADYIVVGGGSAGAVLAARLSEDEGADVLLLEAGGETGQSLYVRMPTAFSLAMGDRRFNWGWRTAPEPGMDGRRMDCPRGRGLGGSSAINGMVWVRGHPQDFDAWGQEGAEGWDFAACLPYFKRAEHWAGEKSPWRGAKGPLAVSGGNGMRLNPLYRAFMEAGREAGWALTEDVNGACQEGFGAMQMSVGGGERCSTYRAYLAPARGRANLRIQTHCLIERIVFHGRRAAGVMAETGGAAGGSAFYRARREVILAAGAIGSPALLQRSGVGPAALLKSLGLEVVLDAPGAGAGLQDHLEVYFQHRCLKPVSLNGQLSLAAKAAIGARWLLTKRGLGATNHFESGGFVRSDPAKPWPDLQFHFLPGAIRYDGGSALKGHGFQVHVGPNKPASRGEVRIASAKAAAEPAILFNYLHAEADRQDWRASLRLTREILSQPALGPWRGEEVQPGAAVQSDDELDAFVREHAESAYHPCGTCRMGAADDKGAVLDGDCRVRGLEGLRVADASAFPSIPNGNINAPVIMLAERASDLIRGRTLPPEPLAWHPAPRHGEHGAAKGAERAPVREAGREEAGREEEQGAP